VLYSYIIYSSKNLPVKTLDQVFEALMGKMEKMEVME